MLENWNAMLQQFVTHSKDDGNDMLAKTDDERIWMLNPRLLVKGDIIVKARLMSKYDSLLGRPLSDWIITDSNGNDPLFLPIEYPTPESLDTAKAILLKCIIIFETLSGLGGKESEVLNFWCVQCETVIIHILGR